jgi:hypothetical protein
VPLMIDYRSKKEKILAQNETKTKKKTSKIVVVQWRTRSIQHYLHPMRFAICLEL